MLLQLVQWIRSGSEVFVASFWASPFCRWRSESVELIRRAKSPRDDGRHKYALGLPKILTFAAVTAEVFGGIALSIGRFVPRHYRMKTQIILQLF